MTREGWTDHPPVPASTVEYATLFQSFFFDSIVVHDTSPKPFFPTAALQPRLCVRLQTLFNHTVLANLFALPFPHHFRPGNWANWKPMSAKCGYTSWFGVYIVNVWCSMRTSNIMHVEFFFLWHPDGNITPLRLPSVKRGKQSEKLFREIFKSSEAPPADRILGDPGDTWWPGDKGFG